MPTLKRRLLSLISILVVTGLIPVAEANEIEGFSTFDKAQNHATTSGSFGEGHTLERDLSFQTVNETSLSILPTDLRHLENTKFANLKSFQSHGIAVTTSTPVLVSDRSIAANETSQTLPAFSSQIQSENVFVDTFSASETPFEISPRETRLAAIQRMEDTLDGDRMIENSKSHQLLNELTTTKLPKSIGTAADLQAVNGKSVLLAQNEYGRYFQGVSGGLRLANPPVPGFVIDNAFIFYSTNTFVDGDGNRNDLGAFADPIVNRTAVVWGPDVTLLGASYGVVVSIPLANLNTRPFPGVQASFGVGDIYFQPLTLGWKINNWNIVTSYGFWAPTGRFESGSSRNIGRGFFTNMVALGTTYTSSNELPWLASLMARYEIHTEIQGSNIHPGDTFTLEYGVGKTVSPNFDVGLAGYMTFQTTTTTGSDFTGDPTRYQYFGLGPELQYRIPSSRLRLRLNSYIDFGALNAAEGFSTIFSIAYRP